jgi:uncharacterized membrane protein
MTARPASPTSGTDADPDPGATSDARSTTKPPSAFGGANLLFAFLPWIIFDVVSGPSTWKYAVLAAFVAALLLSRSDFQRHQVKLLDVVSIGFFGALCVAAFVVDRDDLLWLETYAQVVANGALAVVALGSLLFTPFTVAYAKESTPSELWHSKRFVRTNQVLTALWGSVFAVNALVGWWAVHYAAADDWLNWVVPIVLLVVAIKITIWYPEHVHAQAQAEAAAAAAKTSDANRLPVG